MNDFVLNRWQPNWITINLVVTLRLRNHGLAMLKTPWCLTLDATERLDPQVFDFTQKPPCSRNRRNILVLAQPRRKIQIHRRLQMHSVSLWLQQGRTIHENVQPSLRRHGATAQWSDAVILEHHPEAKEERLEARNHRNLCYWR